MKLRFSLRMLLVATTLACIAVFLWVDFWPRPQVPGAPNLFVSLVDPNGDSVADAAISICSRRNAPICEVTTDRRGSIFFEPVDLTSSIPLGFYCDPDRFLDAVFNIQVKHETHFLKSSLIDASKWQRVNLIKDFDYVYELEMSLGGNVSGGLTNESGVPITSTKVRLVCQSQPSYVREFTTDQTGRFRTFALPPEIFDVQISLSDVEKLNVFNKIDIWRLEWSNDGSDFFNLGEVQIKVGQTVDLELQFPISLKDDSSNEDSNKVHNSTQPVE